MREQIRGYFRQLLEEKDRKRPRLDNLKFRKVNEASGAEVEQQFTEKEILDGFKECNGDKASDPDDFNI